MVSPLEYGIFIIGSLACLAYGVAVAIVHLFSKK